MSQENVETFKRGVEAGNHRDIEAALEELDPEVEWRPALPVLLGGDATVYRGHEGIREVFREVYAAFVEVQIEISEVRDLGDRIVAIGRIRTRGRESGAETESPLGYLAEFNNGRMVRIWSYLDPDEARKAAGLSE
jgi:ketosteroid isomerase-like protein